MRGFTLIELIVTTAIMAIMVSVGVPSFKSIMDNHEASISLSTLRRTLQKTRTIALQTAQSALVCPIENKRCVSDWSLPLSIFNDLNNNFTLDDGEQLHIQVSNGVNHGYWQKKKANQSYIKFSPLGHAYGSATTFLYCSNSKNEKVAKQLVINFQGRIRTDSYLNGNGTPFPNVDPLNCE